MSNMIALVFAQLRQNRNVESGLARPAGPNEKQATGPIDGRAESTMSRIVRLRPGLRIARSTRPDAMREILVVAQAGVASFEMSAAPNRAN
jgi:hypothetical protein